MDTTVETITGNCFHRAIEEMQDALRSPNVVDVRLCHGAPIGTGGDVKGRRYWHAWVEVKIEGQGWAVIDRSNSSERRFPPGTAVPRDLYYQVGQIEHRQVIRYTPPTAVRWVSRTQHSGPWADLPAYGMTPNDDGS